jgi:integrase
VKKKIPSYRLHKPSGQAVVSIQRHDHYLGPWGSPESKAKYAKIIHQLQAGEMIEPPGGICVAEAVLGYLDWADQWYRDSEGRSTRQICRIKRALATLADLYGPGRLALIGPREIRVCLQKWVQEGLSRQYSNALLVVLKTSLKAMARNGIYPAEQWVQVNLVEGLKLGRTIAPECPATTAVPEEDLRRTIEVLPQTLKDMVQLQLLTGARSGEIVSWGLGTMDRSGPIWIYKPRQHKNRWRGMARTIVVGPQGQLILSRYPSEEGMPIFSWVKGHESGAYTVASYAKAILRICRKQGIPPWRPGQLRHNAAERIQQSHGWEAARTILGHRSIDTTRIYADRDLDTARMTIRDIG